MKLNKKHILLGLLSVSGLYATDDNPEIQHPATYLNSPLAPNGLGDRNPFNGPEVRAATAQTALDAVIARRGQQPIPTVNQPVVTSAPTPTDQQVPTPTDTQVPTPTDTQVPTPTEPAALAAPEATSQIKNNTSSAQPQPQDIQTPNTPTRMEKLMAAITKRADKAKRLIQIFGEEIEKCKKTTPAETTQPQAQLKQVAPTQKVPEQSITPQASKSQIQTTEIAQTVPEPTITAQALESTGAGWGLVPFVAGGLLAGWAYNRYLCTQTLPANTQCILIEVRNKESKKIAVGIESGNIASTAEAINTAIATYTGGNFFNNDDQQKVTVEVTAFTDLEKRTGNRLLFGLNGITLTLPKNDFGKALWDTLLANRLQPQIYNGISNIPGRAHKTLKEITITATTVAAENPRLDTAPLVATGTAFAALKGLGAAGLITATTPWLVPAATAVLAAGMVYGIRERISPNFLQYTYGSTSKFVHGKFGYRIPECLHLRQTTELFSITARTAQEAKDLFVEKIKNNTGKIQVSMTVRYTQNGHTESYKITPVILEDVTKNTAADGLNRVQPLLNA